MKNYVNELKKQLESTNSDIKQHQILKLLKIERDLCNSVLNSCNNFWNDPRNFNETYKLEKDTVENINKIIMNYWYQNNRNNLNIK